MRHGIIISLLLAAFCANAGAQCELPIAVVTNEAYDMPEAAREVLQNQLERVAVASGAATEVGFTQFILTARISTLEKNVLSGPPPMYSANFGITLYIADVVNRQKYASTYVEVDAIGKSEQQCYLNACRRLNANNSQIRQFLDNGKRKVMNYFDKNYPQILAEAKRKLAMQDYETALALAAAVPECSAGGGAAGRVAVDIYVKYRDRLNQKLLSRAQAIWNAGQDGAACAEAGDLLARIDPEAACYGAATALATEMKKQVRSDINFEMREKYRDAAALRRQQVEAARAVGVAFGSGQKAQTTNIAWLR